MNASSPLKQSTQDDYARRLLRVQTHLESALDAPPTAPEMAKLAGLSLHHFHRVFRGQTGESLMGYGRRLRLERAARELRYAKRSVADIALDAGYASHEAFTRAFRRHFDVAPAAFRDGDGVPCPRLVPQRSRGAVDIRSADAMEVLFMRHVGPYVTVGTVWESLMGVVEEMNMTVELNENGGPRMLALVHDDPEVTPSERLRYDACLLVDGARPPMEGPVMGYQRIEAGRYAVMTHRGSYETLSETYLDLIGRWFVENGRVPSSSPVIERYVNSPRDTAPDALQTEIWVRIEERGFMQ